MPPQTPSCPLHRDDTQILLMLGELKQGSKDVKDRLDELNRSLFDRQGILQDFNQRTRQLEDWQLATETRISEISKAKRRHRFTSTIVHGIFGIAGVLLSQIANYFMGTAGKH